VRPTEGLRDGSGIAVWRTSCQRFGERARRFGRANQFPKRRNFAGEMEPVKFGRASSISGK